MIISLLESVTSLLLVLLDCQCFSLLSEDFLILGCQDNHGFVHSINSCLLAWQYTLNRSFLSPFCSYRFICTVGPSRGWSMETNNGNTLCQSSFIVPAGFTDRRQLSSCNNYRSEFRFFGFIINFLHRHDANNR